MATSLLAVLYAHTGTGVNAGGRPRAFGLEIDYAMLVNGAQDNGELSRRGSRSGPGPMGDLVAALGGAKRRTALHFWE